MYQDATILDADATIQRIILKKHIILKICQMWSLKIRIIIINIPTTATSLFVLIINTSHELVTNATIIDIPEFNLYVIGCYNPERSIHVIIASALNILFP